MIQYIKLLVIS